MSTPTARCGTRKAGKMGELKRGYKQTEVGVIPQDWEAKSLGLLVSYTNGKAHEREIIESGRFVVVNSKFISSAGLTRKYSDNCLCPTLQGEVLMVMSDVPNGRAIAKCYWVESSDTYTVNQRICILSPRGVDGRLLFYLLDRNAYYLAFDDGAKQTNLRRGEVLACPLGMPKSIEEQRAIAGVLGDVDALIGALDRLIAKKSDLKQAAMQQLLTGQTRLPGFGGKWETKTLGATLTIKHGRSQHQVESANGRYPILATGGEIGRAAQFIYDKPSVLIGRKGTIDRPQYMDTPFWTVDTLFYSIIQEPNDAKFLFYRFCAIDWKQYNEASGVPSLNARTIERIEIKFPGAQEQTAIASVLSDMDSELSALEERLHKTRLLKQGMMQELLTGRIRLS
jgi:type I restriction enzyme, S subunit